MLAQYLVAYGVTATAFLLLDFLWLSYVARQFYWAELGDILLERPHLGVAVMFYLVYVVGIVIFAVAPSLRDGSAVSALIFGALFGFFAYATYDITNLATLKNWSISVTVVDILCGTCLTGLASVVGYSATRAIFAA